MKEIFKQLIVDFHEREIPKLTERDIQTQIPLTGNKIISLIGVRRSGKTSILLESIRQLRKSNPTHRIVYLNFEDDRLFNMNISDLSLLTDAYYELFPEEQKERTWWFFDEIQNIEGWEQFVRRIHDTENAQLFITGSSSKLLSSELATALRGRTISYEVFPFSFTEYLRHTKTEINLYSSQSLHRIRHHFQHYLFHGGFAETFGQSKDIERRILTDYLDLIIYRDLIERHNISNRALLKHLIRHLFTNPATLTSFHKLFNEFKSQGFKLSKDTLIEYFNYLHDAFAVFHVPIFRSSVHDQQRNPKKSYIIDNSYKQLFDAFSSRDLGKLYENLVFLHLRRKSSVIYYFKRKYEVDFYVKIENKSQLINVCVSLEDSQTKEREVRSLQEAMSALNLGEATLLTADQEETITTKEGVIQILPVWKWICLNPD